jgi:hypothetical protein
VAIEEGMMDEWVKKSLQLGAIIVMCVVLVGVVYLGIQTGVQRLAAAVTGDAVTTYAGALQRAEDDLRGLGEKLRDAESLLAREREWTEFLEIGLRGANARALRLAIELTDLATVLNGIIEDERGHRGDVEYGTGLVSRGAIILDELEEILTDLNNRGGE